MYDCALRLASAGNLTASETSAPGVLVGPDLDDQEIMVHVPQATGTTPTLDIKIQESDDNSTWKDVVVFPQINAAGQYFRAIKSNKKYRRYYATVGGTSPNFGAVLIAFVPAGRYDKH